MNIEVHEPRPNECLNEPNEVWVHVTTDTPPPGWPEVRREVVAQRPDLAVPFQPRRYIPGGPMSDDSGKSLWEYEDFWIFKKEVCR